MPLRAVPRVNFCVSCALGAVGRSGATSRHANVKSMSRQRHVSVTSMSRQCHVDAMAMSRQCHANV
eukprot:6720074-Lingulodinium_polyedra.AAC.1